MTAKKTGVRAIPYSPEHLDALRELINLHVSAAVPGWWLPSTLIGRTLERNHGQYVIDPWVAERATFVVGTTYRLSSAVHVLRYRDEEDVHQSSRGGGVISWVLGRPDEPAALRVVLAAAVDRCRAWGAPVRRGWDAGLPVPVMGMGVPDVWTHIAAALGAAGFQPGPADESLYGGTLEGIPPPGDAPLSGLRVQRAAGDWSALFLAELDGETIGRCEVTADLTGAGERPALRGWAELDEMNVDERWRNQGVGTWLLRHGVAWLRLAGCDRIVLSVGADDEARGAGRFYRRFGWDALLRETRSWRRL